MLRIASDKCIYSMDRHHEPVAEVGPGSLVCFETKDCFGNQVRTESDLFSPDSWAGINPATGPLRIKGAEPGDVLAVKVLEIELAAQGAMIAVPGMGALGHHITHNETKIVPLRDGYAHFNEQLQLPVRPMIGVIGTAPAEGEIPNGTPGRHGGNMDTKLIAPATTVYLPVFVGGANLSIGDIHALMGDGEVVICGIEVAAEVLVRVDVVKGTSIPSPILETADAFYCLASAVDLDAAAEMVLDDALAFLRQRLPLSVNHLAMLMSLVCDLQISQVVDPLKTVRLSIPKRIFGAYGLRF